MSRIGRTCIYAERQLLSRERRQHRSGSGLRAATNHRAMQACRKAGSSIDPQTQQSIQRLHDEVSSLKKQIQMG